MLLVGYLQRADAVVMDGELLHVYPVHLFRVVYLYAVYVRVS